MNRLNDARSRGNFSSVKLVKKTTSKQSGWMLKKEHYAPTKRQSKSGKSKKLYAKRNQPRVV